MKSFPADQGSEIVRDLIACIVKNRDYLSQIDGAIGDGDHGINMAKGFSLCEQTIAHQRLTLSEALNLLGNTLMGSIGGSMGPLYGTLFMGMADGAAGLQRIDADGFGAMLRGGFDNVSTVSDAKVGDKSLMDTLVPATEAYQGACRDGRSFEAALDAMTAAADRGRDSTEDLVARIGRASRLGERSRGTLDAGATSCALLLGQLAASIKPLLS